MIKLVLMIFILFSTLVAIAIYSAVNAIDDLEEQWEQIHKKS